MSRNDITGDSLTTKAATDAFREGWDRIFHRHTPVAPFRCVFCGAPSWRDPTDQIPPADYCSDFEHGEPEVFE